uniref:Uncharacterized protein n=1 Tax=Crocodylus porosus TaxID=8502 RepID=A0A7M4EBA9_CROPO
METLDEFDDEYPLSVSFCKLISLEDFEEQSLSYTEQCLQELVTNMEQSPGICERAMRKRKQVEKEEAGLVSFLKAKFFGTLQGEMNCCNYLGIAEMQEKVAQLKRDMQKANSYARGNPCILVSFWAWGHDRNFSSQTSGFLYPLAADAEEEMKQYYEWMPVLIVSLEQGRVGAREPRAWGKVEFGAGEPRPRLQVPVTEKGG